MDLMFHATCSDIKDQNGTKLNISRILACKIENGHLTEIAISYIVFFSQNLVHRTS